MNTDITTHSCELYFIPVETRVPLKFGAEVLTSVICARVCMGVKGVAGQIAQGWGETPLSVQWAWPSSAPYGERCEAMKQFCCLLTTAWADFETSGHPMEIGYEFIEIQLPMLLNEFNKKRSGAEPMPHLAALICCSAFDIALHDAYGQLHDCAIYSTYNAEFMNADLAHFLTPAKGTDVCFTGKYPADYLTLPSSQTLPAWHLVGGEDLLEDSQRIGTEPDDGYPVVLRDWIKRDGLTCLKIKLRGNDSDWDFNRLKKVGQISMESGVTHLTTDFNCTVTDPAYVNDILDHLKTDFPRIYDMILYVEQPFPYDLEANRIDVHSVSSRQPLFMDESAHDWKLVRLGRELGWTGVALKTCKTQTGALLSLCWARAHGMALMVQDLTNPMLAQIPHLLLAAHAGTIMGVETNGMQFYPEASAPEAAIHPGLYQRRDGLVNLSSIKGPGFGYRLHEIKRELPNKAVL
jgi:L-alanine-DL-glutamate epimerase-like enolase superfamily enzyme